MQPKRSPVGYRVDIRRRPVMKRSDLIPVAMLLPVIGFVAAQVGQRTSRAASHRAVPVAIVSRTEAGRLASATEVPAPVPVVAADARPTTPARDVEDIRRRLSLGASGTYIDEILAERDSALARWPDRVSQPIRVWVGSGAQVSGWSPTFPDRVRDAFAEWSALGIPVRFVFVPDSSDADVHVSWIDHFDTPISGKTLWARDRNWWIVSANITLALHHNGGEALDDSSVKAIALHEVGHLLGLDHTVDTTNIMTAKVRVRDLSAEDRATMRLLYTLPPGSVREGQ